METFPNFALWFGFMFLIMRAGCHAQETGRGQPLTGAGNRSASKPSPDLRWAAPERDVEPVCKKTVATKTAKSSVYAGQIHYFCSRDCREIFEAAPEFYLDIAVPKTLEHINVQGDFSI